MPIFNVPKDNGQYPVIPADVMFSIPNTKRTSRGAYQRSDWTWDWDTYQCLENGWEEKIDDREVKLYRGWQYLRMESMPLLHMVSGTMIY